MSKLAKIIDDLSQEDVLKIKRDLVAGNIDRLIDKKIKLFDREKLSEKFCPVCNAEIKEDAFILEFGASYLRKKAYFDALDCLEYFTSTRLRENVLRIEEKDEKKEDHKDTKDRN